MEKRCVFLIFFSIILLSNFVIASDVAYVLKNPSRADSGFMDVFNEMNLDVKLIRNTEVYFIDFSKYKFIFVGDERLKNARLIPVNNYPSVIANGYYGEEFGLTNAGGISRLASNSPLKIKKDGNVIQVYEKSSFKLGGIGIPYYYLPYKYQKNYMSTIATTSVGYGSEKGDVISYSTQGPEKCFFGITKTKFWTQDAKELFKECVNFVLEGSSYEESFCGDNNCDEGENCETCPEDCGECALEPECEIDFDCGESYFIGDNYCFEGNVVRDKNIPRCIEGNCEREEIVGELVKVCDKGCENKTCIGEEPEQVHDVIIDETYSNTINGIRIKDVESGEYLLNEISELTCNKEYEIKFKTKNIGDFEEDANISASINGIEWNEQKTIVNYAFTINKIIINTSGFYTINVLAEIEEDANPENNFKSRQIEVVCS